MTARVKVLGLSHVGLRVHDLDRSLAFYELLGFHTTFGPGGPVPVAIIEHPAGIEINLILNAPAADTPNVLMDVPPQRAGLHAHLTVSRGRRRRLGDS